MIQIFLFDRFDLFCFFMLASNDGHESNAVLFGLIFGWCSGTASIGTVSNHRQRHYPCGGTPLDWIGVRTGRHGPERDAKKRHVREVFVMLVVLVMQLPVPITRCTLQARINFAC